MIEASGGRESIAACANGRSRRLVDARFLRGLDAGEKNELELHLASCGPCTERYRRLQLAERVASVGPERAFEEPSPLEIERIARDLQLLEAPADRWAWLRDMRGAVAGLSAAVAIAAAIGVFVAVRPPQETLIARGGAEQRAATFSMFVIGADGAIRPYAEDGALKASELIKLRASWSGAEPKHVAVAIVDAAGAVRVAQLGAPKGASTGATIPGAIALAGSSAGDAIAYLLASESAIDESALRAAIAASPDAETLRASLKVLAVDRRVLHIAESATE